MESNMKNFRAAFLSFLGGIAGTILLTAPGASAQTTVSTFTLQVEGTAPAVKTGLPETVRFAGPVVITATVVTDPALPPGVVLYIDGRGVQGTGLKTGTVYNNEAEANLTRPFGATDHVETTFAFFENAAGSFIRAKGALLTLNLTYDTNTMSLTKVTGDIGTL
jgi:hypothetical protein